jgi:hypothetical protein
MATVALSGIITPTNVVTATSTTTLTNKTIATPTITGVATFSAGTAALPALTTSGDTNTGIFFPAADSVATSVAGAEGTRLTSTGLGVGATPQAKLHVAGNIIANESQKIGFRYASGDPGPYVYMSAGAASTSLNFYANASGTTTDKNYIFHGTASNTEIVNILGNGNISTIGLVDISAATAGQIKFPATQNASANANTLDDYEEGTWTGTLTGGTTNPTVTYTERTGRYVKVGGLVYINGEISGSTTGGSGQMQITGLPFTSLAAQPPWYASTLGVVNTTGGTTPTIAMVTASGTLIGMWAGSTATNWGSTTLVDWYFSAVYPAS